VTVRGRRLLALLGIGVVVLVLGLYRSWAPADLPATAPEETPAQVLPTLLDFGRGECSACKKMMPVLDSLAERHAGRIAVRYLDLSRPENQERATAMKVRVIPTQILVAADGNEVARHEGFWALAEIEARLEGLGWTPAR
jgi:thioredoxin 1